MFFLMQIVMMCYLNVSNKVENVDMKKLDNIIDFPCFNHWAVNIADRKKRILYHCKRKKVK